MSYAGTNLEVGLGPLDEVFAYVSNLPAEQSDAMAAAREFVDAFAALEDHDLTKDITLPLIAAMLNQVTPRDNTFYTVAADGHVSYEYVSSQGLCNIMRRMLGKPVNK